MNPRNTIISWYGPSDNINESASTKKPTKWISKFHDIIPGLPQRDTSTKLPISIGLVAVVRSHFARPKSVIVTLSLGVLFLIGIRLVSNNVIAKKATLVFDREEIRKIYEWEIKGGNYPTRRRIPREIGIPHSLHNPAVSPASAISWPDVSQPPFLVDGLDNFTIGVGPERIYQVLRANLPNTAYPPRPIPGSIADLDKIMQYCDFNTGRYVRDCLEVMKVGGGLDNGRRLRRGNLEHWKYIFRENSTIDYTSKNLNITWTEDAAYGGFGTRSDKHEKIDYKIRNLMRLPSPDKKAVGMCDPERSRIFHVYWAGSFTDKPYLILLSYLYTQPLDLHIPPSSSRPTNRTSSCRPQFWVWINPGIQASVPNPNAERNMLETLAANPWSAPFLHKRFHDLVKFRLWNTTAQLDAHPELAEWRKHNVLGKLAIDTETAKHIVRNHDLLGKTAENLDGRHKNEDGKASVAMVQLKAADSAQVIMSDLARFLVTHAYGGLYLDVDHVLLRDWEELWNWPGAFAMRWSYHEWYNTAVLKMHRNSALGSFLLKTAIANTGREPFHPEAISRYMRDARMEPLMFRIPDALFDSNFLNMEKRQRDRPPFPAYSMNSGFAEFFKTPARTGADGQAGFDAFYRGAYAYHWHNNWEKPVDISRNFPDLQVGERFEQSEQLTKQDDEQDLSWSAVLKRTFEAYLRGEEPNMYGEWCAW